MARVTPAEVREIADIDVAVTNLNPFILVANQLVTELCTASSLDDDRLKEIERWLSAHFACIRDPQRDNEKAGSVGEKFQYKVDLGLNQTRYGQQAMLLDTSNALNNANKGVPRASFAVIDPIS